MCLRQWYKLIEASFVEQKSAQFMLIVSIMTNALYFCSYVRYLKDLNDILAIF